MAVVGAGLGDWCAAILYGRSLSPRRTSAFQLATGLGNAVDVAAGDVLTYLVGDEGTRDLALHLESVADGDVAEFTAGRVGHRVFCPGSDPTD